jgi:hypothetical protein
MPVLGLSKRDATDLIAYMEEVSSQISETQGNSPINHQHHQHRH